MKNGIKYVGLPVIFTLFATRRSRTEQLHGCEQDHSVGLRETGERVCRVPRAVDGQLPKLPKKATAEEIQAHKAALLKSVQAARAGAKHGDVFTPAASTLVRNIIKAEFKGRDRRELRETVFEAETKGVPIKVNAAYPEAKELTEMPPSLLLASATAAETSAIPVCRHEPVTRGPGKQSDHRLHAQSSSLNQGVKFYAKELHHLSLLS